MKKKPKKTGDDAFDAFIYQLNAEYTAGIRALKDAYKADIRAWINQRVEAGHTVPCQRWIRGERRTCRKPSVPCGTYCDACRCTAATFYGARCSEPVVSGTTRCRKHEHEGIHREYDGVSYGY